ncbi:MAG: HEAT repeat domain-containing protein [Planctomycetaceae bacterium]
MIEDLAHLGRGALPALIAFQSDPNGRIREAGTRAVKRVHSENVQFSDNEPRDCDPVVLQAILQRVNELVAPDNTCRFWASIALEQIRISTRARKTVALQKATAKCLTGLSSPDANIRLEVASFLGRVAGCEEIVPLRACVQDETEVLEIRCNAFRSLVEIGFDVGDLALSAADSLLAVRKEVANSQSFFRCRAFIEAVGNLESSADSFIPILFDLQRSLPENEPSQVPQVPKRP